MKTLNLAAARGAVRAAAQRLGAVANSNFPDALLICGAALVSYGAWLVYAPAGFIVGGAILLVGGVLASRSAG